MDIKDIKGDITGKATDVWSKNKYAIIGAVAGLLVFFCVMCYCCIRCRRKKKKKDAEKIKLKGAKPTKKLKRIQPNKTERKAMEELGSVKFTLQYDKTSEMLMVKVLETTDVPVRDLSGYAYAFVVVKLLPHHEHEEAEYKTKMVRAGFWPAFGDMFSFVIEKEDLKEQVLYLYQYELNRWSKQDGIGQIAYEVKDGNLLSEKVGEIEVTRKLRPYNPLLGLEVEAGAVYLALEYDAETWELKVEIRQADIIPQDEDQEKASSYVTLTLLNKDDEKLEKRRTSNKRGTLQPSYDTEVTYNVPDNLLPEVKMLLKLKSKHYFKPSSVLGKTTILPTSDNWKQLLDKEYTEGWFSVFTKPKTK
ncbi:synaptotagmin-2-like [Hydractinia symbiolongicarpus]|uniref:synaptotagmin-2-like n=1 Tax=Hydractinia symbiolongicarpus TaxID=13093 RepID=UPI00254A3293|nr:synaptotagmin-2-like [Hydractinia symbiolongicarpus]